MFFRFYFQNNNKKHKFNSVRKHRLLVLTIWILDAVAIDRFVIVRCEYDLQSVYMFMWNASDGSCTENEHILRSMYLFFFF